MSVEEIDRQRKKDEESKKKVVAFLFDEKGKKYLDTATDVGGRELMKGLMYYRGLEEHLKSKVAGMIADIMERLLISKLRAGRKEGVESLQNLGALSLQEQLRDYMGRQPMSMPLSAPRTKKEDHEGGS